LKSFSKHFLVFKTIFWQIRDIGENNMLLECLEIINQRLLKSSSIHDRIVFLDQLPQIREFLKNFGRIDLWLKTCVPEEELVLKQLIVIGEAEQLVECSLDCLEALLAQLVTINRFYRELGGIVGYQIEILKRLQKPTASVCREEQFHSPVFHDVSENTPEVKKAIYAGIEALPYTAELYPLGGAADRLHLIDQETGHDLPAAKMTFGGRSLLEGLIRDLQAREYLYYQQYGKKIFVPIGIMTSPEKNNHCLVKEICESHQWFGRPKELFRFFCQPLVPAIDQKGKWIWIGPGKPLLKPGGHGAIWKLARDKGIFDWLQKLGVKQLIVRQINNPLAGIDYGLLAFLGIGTQKKMTFGFVSCPRLLKAAEGVNVVMERKNGECVERVLTNIEYCDFARYGIDDTPLEAGGKYSRFTCNANILFANLEDLKKAVEVCPFPGLLINLKQANIVLENGEKKEIAMARLESTMQNIADLFVEEHPLGSVPKTDRTFVMYNHRRKTISTAKKAYFPGGLFQETPEQSFYDILQASKELFALRCGFTLPSQRSVEEVEQLGPECCIVYHPALGPLYSVIEQKVKRGVLLSGSELLLEIANLDLEDLELDGSLCISAEVPTEGKCILKRVRVCNRGVDWTSSRPFWKYQFVRTESMNIHLKGVSEFIAEDVLFAHDQKWVVEAGIRMTVFSDGTVKEERLN
jgi:hypothetical protein